LPFPLPPHPPLPGPPSINNQKKEYDLFLPNLAWNLVDLLILASAFWSAREHIRLVHYQHKLTTWSLDPTTTLFLVCNAQDMVFPFSLLVFLIFLRLLRFLNIFPGEHLVVVVVMVGVEYELYEHKHQEEYR